MSRVTDPGLGLASVIPSGTTHTIGRWLSVCNPIRDTNELKRGG
jgi:hypothetical protein